MKGGDGDDDRSLCLDVQATTTTQLHLTPCTTITTLDQAETSSQLWSVMGAAAGNNTNEQQQQYSYYYLHSVGHRGQCVAAAAVAAADDKRAAAGEVGLADCHQHATNTSPSSLQQLLTLPRPPSATYGPAPIVLAREYYAAAAPDCLDDDNDNDDNNDNLLHWVDCHRRHSSEWQALAFDHHYHYHTAMDHPKEDDDDDDDDDDTVHYQFRSTRTGLCLGLSDNDDDDDDNDDTVHPVPCDTSHMGTFWRVHKDGRVSSQADSSLCWDTSSSSSSTLLQVTPCSTSTGSSSSNTIVRALQQQQQVFLGPTPIVRFDGTCLQASSDRLTEDDCNDTPEQQFRLGPISAADSYLIQSVTTGACVVRNDDDDITTNGPCDASNANAVWTLNGDVQNDATASTTITNNNDLCLTSTFFFRQQSGLFGLLVRILNLLRNVFGVDRRVELGSSCTEAAAQNTLSLNVQQDPWLGPIPTSLVASAMANRPDGA